MRTFKPVNHRRLIAEATPKPKESYYDGEWRPVTNTSDIALEKLRSRGFEFGADKQGRLMARWPVAPAAPEDYYEQDETGDWIGYADGRRTALKRTQEAAQADVKNRRFVCACWPNCDHRLPN